MKNFENRTYAAFLKSGVCSMLMGAAALSATSANAQDLQDQEAAAEEIIVTGSRIARPDLSANSPVNVIEAEVFQQQGTVNIENVVNQLPAVTPGFNASSNNPGDGTATVDLRGLGPSRTLVLINGRRAIGSRSNGTVDLGSIPAALIERVDVVTGGASAVYGSDALAGVVNFILKDDFEGVEVGGQYGVTESGDGDSWQGTVLLGSNFGGDRGNAVLSIQYNSRGDILQGDREFFRVDGFGGSATGRTGRFDNVGLNPFIDYTTAEGVDITGGLPVAFNPDGSIRPFVNTLDDPDGGDRYNFAPLNYLQLPQNRVLLNALAHYDITDNVEAFAEIHFSNVRSSTQLAPTPATGLQVDPLSPVLSQDARDFLAARPDPLAPAQFRRRLFEVGPRFNDITINTFQLVTGLKGEINDNWSWDAFYSYGRSERTDILYNDASRTRLEQGLSGCPVGSADGCVPVNAFGVDNISEEAADFVRIAASTDFLRNDRHNFGANIVGDLIELPAGAVATAFGVEYRRDSSSFTPSESSQQGDLTGFNAQLPTAGVIDVYELYGEVIVPIVSDLPFAEYLGLEAGFRYSDYSTVGSITTYKIGGEWSPVSDIRFRGLYQKATRAPNVVELFRAGDQSFPTLTDPCASTLPNGDPQTVEASALPLCDIQGLGDVTVNPFTQVNSQVEASLVGNPDLSEEESDTFTIGAVISPRWVEGLTVSVDYFSIKIDDVVTAVAGGASGIVSECFASGATTAAEAAADPFCSLITRDAGGSLFVTVPSTNEGSLKTTGVDFQVRYSTELADIGLGDYGRIDLLANATYNDKYELNGDNFAGLSTFDFGALPEWRYNTRLTYSFDKLSTTLNWRRVGSYEETFLEEEISAFNYLDLSARYDVTENLEVYGGINNLLDKDPPFVIANGFSGNSDGTNYDVFGRRFFIGAKLRY
ncbi:MAG: TonB-dependent receptor [Sphingomonadales bacterium]